MEITPEIKRQLYRGIVNGFHDILNDSDTSNEIYEIIWERLGDNKLLGEGEFSDKDDAELTKVADNVFHRISVPIRKLLDELLEHSPNIIGVDYQGDAYCMCCLSDEQRLSSTPITDNCLSLSCGISVKCTECGIELK